MTNEQELMLDYIATNVEYCMEEDIFEMEVEDRKMFILDYLNWDEIEEIYNELVAN